MPYIPDLIPENSKVIPQYFQSAGSREHPGKTKTPAGQILTGVIFLIIALYFIRYTGFAVLLVLLAASCTGGGKRWLERRGRFALTRPVRIILYLLVMLTSIPVYLAYQHEDELADQARQAANERAVRFTADSLRTDSARRLKFYASLDKAAQLQPDSGLRLVAQSELLARTAAEKDTLSLLQEQLQVLLVQKDLGLKNYQRALATAQKLLEEKPNQAGYLFYRARCYIGLDSMQLAVNDLDSAKVRNFKPADRLFEKINPLKRHLTGRCTLCADGSISFATGRGACSWHGGVAEWDHPMYETYREYGN